MTHIKYLILGAGPAGLSFAQQLKRRGETSFCILEKENEAGGLCRSAMVDGSPFDIGGGHFLDVRRPEVNSFLFSFMPEEEWTLYNRDSRIRMKDMEIGHPFEANIWQMCTEEQVAYLKSIALAGCNTGVIKPERFVDWITWKLGDKVANNYMLPYNQKMFADELNELGTYWLEKLPNVSFEDTLRSCLEHKPYGTQPGHAAFYYSQKYGYGEVWRRMAEDIADHIIYDTNVIEMDCDCKKVKTAAGDSYTADIIVTTIPWASFTNLTGISDELRYSIGRLRNSAIETRYVPEQLNTKAHWIYEPDPDLPYHRILVRHNFCRDSRGYWLETRKERTEMYAEGSPFCYLNEYAYPLNTIDKPAIMKNLLEFAASRKIYGLGRWGEHSHYNSDLTVELAIKLEEKLR